MTQIPSASELNRITDDLQAAKRQAELARQAQDDRAAESLKHAFQSRELAPDVADRINLVIRAAAERGERNVLVLRFPSSFCTDGGRRINNGEEDWPDSLDGFARTAFDYFVRELRPLGFTMRAQIIDFRDGMPGDVGLYLHW
ncbi:hypothetical protein [Brevundimonas sp.]|uniref:hypothetical protein n=1 Tax=Brevundimonas sp. TaxID=1871086 RepID=UPI002FC6B197